MEGLEVNLKTGRHNLVCQISAEALCLMGKIGGRCGDSRSVTLVQIIICPERSAVINALDFTIELGFLASLTLLLVQSFLSAYPHIIQNGKNETSHSPSPRAFVRVH
jgi:hypothetical protein